MRALKLLIMLIAAAGAFAFFLVPQGKTYRQYLVVSFGDEPATLDPAVGTGIVEFRFYRALFEGLVKYNPENPLELIPGLAQSWDVTGTTWTFHLRENAKFSDGIPITAQTFADSFFRVLNCETPSEYAYMLYYIKGAKEYRSQKIDERLNKIPARMRPEEVGIRVVDARTLFLELNANVPYFLELLALPVYSAVPVHAIARFGSKEWVKPGNFAGSGPFTIESWVPRSKIVLARNPYYYEKVEPERVVCISSSETTTFLWNEYVNGNIDVLPGTHVPAAARNKMTADRGYRKFPSLSITFLRVMNTIEPELRAAIACSIDRSRIARFSGTGGIPWTRFVPIVDLPVYKKYEQIPIKFQPAQSISKWTGRKLVFLARDGTVSKNIFIEISRQLDAALGIVLEPRLLDRASFLANMKEMKYDIALSGWTADIPDPVNHVEIFESTSGNNRTGWKDERFDRLVHQAQAEPDENKRLHMLASAEEILLASAVCIPLYILPNETLVSPRVSGIALNSMDRLVLERARVR